ncbi:hypothetical protein OHA42_29370 [Nocardia sp. NBC_01009]|nr:hypothetical protein OHA42_29370 [Nocardia sp. NBC_01009]
MQPAVELPEHRTGRKPCTPADLLHRGALITYFADRGDGGVDQLGYRRGAAFLLGATRTRIRGYQSPLTILPVGPVGANAASPSCPALDRNVVERQAQ